VDAPPLSLERAAHTRGPRERVVHGPDRDPTFFEGPEDERKKPGFVSDVPHDAARANAMRARLLASPSKTGSARLYWQTCAGVSTACGFTGIANP
jgi:hypothetical protein